MRLLVGPFAVPRGCCEGACTDHVPVHRFPPHQISLGCDSVLPLAKKHGSRFVFLCSTTMPTMHPSPSPSPHHSPRSLSPSPPSLPPSPPLPSHPKATSTGLAGQWLESERGVRCSAFQFTRVEGSGSIELLVYPI